MPGASRRTNTRVAASVKRRLGKKIDRRKKRKGDNNGAEVFGCGGETRRRWGRGAMWGVVSGGEKKKGGVCVIE